MNSNGRRTTSGTIDNYIRALKDAFILYEANRYDIKSKEFLKSLEKYYIVDIGLRNLLLGERTRNIGHTLENIVYLELLRRGYQVSIGKLDLLEVDFIAQKRISAFIIKYLHRFWMKKHMSVNLLHLKRLMTAIRSMCLLLMNSLWVRMGLSKRIS